MSQKLDVKKLGYATEKIATGTERLKRGFAKMQQGGVVMDVTNYEQAKIAEDAGAVAVMALERVPADIRAMGGVARMADPVKIQEIIDSVSIPVMAKCRIGHFVEAQVLESMGVDMVDESEVLTPADPFYHVDKNKFKIPFVCGARNLGEALRRIWEGAAMIRTKGEAGTGNVVEAVKHIRSINNQIKVLKTMSDKALQTYAKNINVPIALVKQIKQLGKLPVVNFAAGGIATPADAAMCMQLGVDGVFVGSGIFKSKHPRKVANAIVKATTYYKNPDILAEISTNLGDAMPGLEMSKLETKMASRGF